VTPDTIEKHILINAPAETVYRIITEPGQITQWFTDAADLEPIPGGEGTLIFADRATTQRMAVKLTVQAAEPPHRFCFRWAYPDGEQPREDNSLLVEFTLTPEGTGTRLTVTETGFAALGKPEQDKADYYQDHDKGWDNHLASLQNYVARQS
jgi:uncharacterized protein YndB with AHSA1/START domain